jgi:hypothetical protein
LDLGLAFVPVVDVDAVEVDEVVVVVVGELLIS